MRPAPAGSALALLTATVVTALSVCSSPPDETGESGTVDWTYTSVIVNETASGTYSLTWDGTEGSLHLEMAGHCEWVAPGSVKPSGPFSGYADFTLVPIGDGGCDEDAPGIAP